jgi:hypothetical protein
MKISFCHPRSAHKTVYFFFGRHNVRAGFTVKDSNGYLPMIHFGFNEKSGDIRLGVSFQSYLILKERLPVLADGIMKVQNKARKLIDTRWKD